MFVLIMVRTTHMNYGSIETSAVIIGMPMTKPKQSCCPLSNNENSVAEASLVSTEFPLTELLVRQQTGWKGSAGGLQGTMT